MPRRAVLDRIEHRLDCGFDDCSRAAGTAGYVLLMTALLIVPLLTFTACAVDLGAWYSQKVKMQAAADAGVLAGVVWALDPSLKWQTVTTNTVAANGFAESARTHVTVSRVGDTRVQVNITQTGHQFFSAYFVEKPLLSVTATADYQRPLQMGSPENRMGTDPELGYQPYYWLNTGSDTTTKANGDRFTSRACATGAWGCASNVNTEYNANGYTYHVAVAPGQTSMPLDIQVFDPAYTFTGDVCESIYIASADMAAVQDMAATRYGESAATAASRYGRSTYCPGDQSLGNGTAPNTTYIVRAPDFTPLNDLDNTPICAITFDGRKPATNAALRNLLSGAGSAIPIGRENAVFSEHFHRWYTICSIPPGFAVQSGEFVVQVKTTAGLSSAPQATTTAAPTLNIGTLAQNTTTNTGGYNRYSLRAGRGPAGELSWGTNISVYSPSRLPIYVNGVDVANGTPKASVPSTVFSTSFFTTRITPEYAGNILQLSFWDIGDVTGSPGTVSFTLTSPDSSVSSSMLTESNCTFKRDGVTIGSQNAFGVTVAGCQISNLASGSGDPSSTGFNGRIVSVTVPVPSDYTCATADQLNGCWIKVAATYRGVPSDTTTWSATMLGDPVHLVE